MKPNPIHITLYVATALSFSLATATASTGKPSVDFSRGALKVSDNHRFLVHSDGSPFFYLGDTAWELFHRLDREQAELYLENRRAKGFNVIQAVVLAELDGLGVPNPYGERPLIDNDPTKPNEAYFRHVDFVVDKAREMGMYIGMLPTWGDKVGPVAWGVGPEKTLTKDNARAYGRFLGNRYKDHPNIIWILGGDRPPKGYEAVWRELAAGLKEGDAGKHPMTYHPNGWASSGDILHKEAWLDFNMIQSGHGGRNAANYELVAKDWKRTPVKPTLDGEPRYEDHPVNFNSGNGWFDAFDVRQAAYWGVFAGGMGTTYGCHDIWQMWTPDRKPVSEARTPWYQALDLPGAWDMQHIRTLMESRPMLDRIPDQGLVAGAQGSGSRYVAATRGTDYAFAYASSGRPFTLKLGKINGDRVVAHWFDPREGTSMRLGEFDNTGTRQFTPPTQQTGRNNDWVLVLDDASKGYAAPGRLIPTDEGLINTVFKPFSANPTGAVVPVPEPLVEVLFDAVDNGLPVNTGSSKALLQPVPVGERGPKTSTNTRGGSSTSSLEFGNKVSAFGALDIRGDMGALKDLKAFTITGWLNCTSNIEGAGGNRVVSWINNGGQGVDLVFRSDRSLHLAVNQWPDSSPARSGAKMVTTDPKAGRDNWVFFAVTYDSERFDDNVQFFFGTRDRTVEFESSIEYQQGPVGTSVGPELTLGHFNTATRNGAPDRMFKGLMDDIRIFGKALSPDEVVAVQKP